MFEMMDTSSSAPFAIVIGIGNGGCNAIDHMMSQGLLGVEFIAVDTDAEGLRSSLAKTTIQLGTGTTGSAATESNPEAQSTALAEDRKRIEMALAGADMIFIVADIGGYMPATLMIADIANKLGILSVALITTPHPSEGHEPQLRAAEGVDLLAKHVDSLIAAPSVKLIAELNVDARPSDYFGAAIDYLSKAVEGIAKLLLHPGLINVDFADVKAVLAARGRVAMGYAVAIGRDRARLAAESAIQWAQSQQDVRGASSVLAIINAGHSLTMGEFDEVGNMVRDIVDDDATIVFGTVIDSNLDDEIRVTYFLASGRGKDYRNVVIPNSETLPLVENWGARQTQIKVEVAEAERKYQDVAAPSTPEFGINHRFPSRAVEIVRMHPAPSDYPMAQVGEQMVPTETLGRRPDGRPPIYRWVPMRGWQVRPHDSDRPDISAVFDHQ